MYDKEKIILIIEDIEKYFNEIENMRIKKESDLDIIKFRAASMDIFSIINKTIDLSEEVVSSKNLGFPMQYKDLFTFLVQSKIIDKKLSEGLKELIILRNKISHRYGAISEKEIFEAIKKIEIVKDFIKSIKREVLKWIRRGLQN